MSSKGLKGRESDTAWNTDTKAQSNATDSLFVSRSLGEGLFCTLEPVFHYGAGCGGCSQKLRWVGSAGNKFILREITAAGAEILREVAQNIHQLEALAKETSLFPEGLDWDAGKVGKAKGADLGPELAHATGHGVGVSY